MNHKVLCLTQHRMFRSHLAGSVYYRLCAWLVVLAGVAVFVVGVCVVPDGSGWGTHRQLNLPTCGFRERTGYPCPTCGMTTSLAYIVRGHVVTGFLTQPAGALGAVALAVVTIAAGYAGLTGHRYGVLYSARFKAIVVVAIGLAVVLAAWGWLCLRVWLRQS